MAPAAGPAIVVAHVNQAMTAEVAVSIRSDREPDPPEKCRSCMRLKFRQSFLVMYSLLVWQVFK